MTLKYILWDGETQRLLHPEDGFIHRFRPGTWWMDLDLARAHAAEGGLKLLQDHQDGTYTPFGADGSAEAFRLPLRLRKANHGHDSLVIEDAQGNRFARILAEDRKARGIRIVSREQALRHTRLVVKGLNEAWGFRLSGDKWLHVGHS